MYYKTRKEELSFMKKLWAGEPAVCPVCKKSELVLLHKKAKKSNNDWKCPECDEVYRTINMLYDLPNE